MSGEEEELKPVCLMIMPFMTKPVDGGGSGDVPAKVDFNALWDNAYRPAIEASGYLAVRADEDPGSVIVKDMLERLAFADLVLADLSLPNGNVYYEVGVRHVTKEENCILFAADWSRQLFDVDQFRTVPYKLTDGSATNDAEVNAIQSAVKQAIETYRGQKTPFYELVSKDADTDTRRGVFRKHAKLLSDFQARVRSARLIANADRRAEEIQKLCDAVDEPALRISDVAVELMQLIRDSLGWDETLVFIDRLPTETKELHTIQEQYLLAVSKTGDHETAIARIEKLVKDHGNSAERQGLIAGRYKRLWEIAWNARRDTGEKRPSGAERRNLNKAIHHYGVGMQLDLNGYFCSPNLSTLLIVRGEDGDQDRSIAVNHVVIEACERVIAHGTSDEWVWPTLLGTAFREGNLEKAEKMADRVDEEGAAKWKLTSTFKDLDIITEFTNDLPLRTGLTEIVSRLKRLTEI